MNLSFFLNYSTAIDAQKVVDGFAKPEVSVHRSLQELRTTDRPMYGVAHSDVKASDGGPRSTFIAAQHYVREAQKRRDELLAKFREEGKE